MTKTCSVKWMEWANFNPLCPKGHDNCDMVNLTCAYVYCYDCNKKYFEVDYETN